MKIKREFAIANKNTFDIQHIHNFIIKYNSLDIISVDPFANTNRIANITNDLDPDMNTDYNMDAYDFLKTLQDNSVDLMLFDPPYSARQVSECYKRLDKTVNMETTQSSFWSKLKSEIGRVVKPQGWCLSFGWNSNGIGKKRNFEIKEILIVAHGGAHYDTICVAEQKLLTLF